jgi:hypothetical protein
MKPYLFYLTIFTALACAKPKIEPCEDITCDTSKLLGKLDTLWTAKIDPDDNPVSRQGIFFQNDRVVVGYSFGLTAGLSIFSPETSKMSFNFKTQEVEVIGSMHPIPSSTSIILQRSGWSTLFNVLTGDRLQTHQFTAGWSANTYGRVIGRHFYNARRSENHDTCYLIRTPFDDLTRWDTIYTLVQGPETGGSRPNVQSFNLWIHPQSSDSILIFQHRMAFNDRVDVLAYNLNSRMILWKHENLTPDGNSNHQQIYIHDNKAFFGGSTVFYAFDLLTGKILWTFNEPRGHNSFMIDDPTYCPITNALIVRGGTKLYSFVPNTGSLNWSIDIGGNSDSGSPTVYKGIIYITSDHRLMAIRSLDGTILYKEFENGPKWGTPTFGRNIVIDSTRNCLYVTDRLRLYAIKLYEEE